LDNICTNMKRSIDDLMSLRPSLHLYTKNIWFLDDIDIYHPYNIENSLLRDWSYIFNVSLSIYVKLK
jgi:hypothetical protein